MGTPPQNLEICQFACFRQPFPALLEVTESVKRLAGIGTTSTVKVASDLGISIEAATARLTRALKAGLIHKHSHKHGWAIEDESSYKPIIRHSPALLEVTECVERFASKSKLDLCDVANDLGISINAAGVRLIRAVKAGLIVKGTDKHGWTKAKQEGDQPAKPRRPKRKTSKR